jgi:hypothetical protein
MYLFFGVCVYPFFRLFVCMSRYELTLIFLLFSTSNMFVFVTVVHPIQAVVDMEATIPEVRLLHAAAEDIKLLESNYSTTAPIASRLGVP